MASTTAVPEGLHDRGKALWTSLGQSVGTPAGDVALEACRIADRLDELDRIIAGKGVLNLMCLRLDLDGIDEAGERQIHVKVEVSGVLGEARQQAGALMALLVKLGMKPAAVRTGPVVSSPLDEMRKRREAKAADKKAGGA